MADPLPLHATENPAEAATLAPTGAAAVERPMQVPGYEILGELGRGGMGVVYQARQVHLNRIVALKMILAGLHAADQDLARFHTEAEAVARLQHPHIVQLYEIGEADRLPFFSLEFCGGGSLETKLHGTPLPPLEAAALLELLARAVHHAHLHGVVHRDLKPANILLTADGIPKVTDFGLAKQMDSQKGQTASGAVLGTPSYMAPEQAAGKGSEIGPTADVYALGAILYECLTGRPPFKAATPLDTLLQVLDQEPVPPSRLQPQVPRDLETICLKCLQKEPPKRYESAEALAVDLRAYLDGRPISARPVGRVGQAWRWCQRNQALATALLAVALALVAGSIVSTVFGIRAQASAERAEEEADQARRARQSAESARTEETRQRRAAEDLAEQNRQQLVRFQVANGARALEGHDPAGAISWFARAMQSDTADRRDAHLARFFAVWRHTPRPVLRWRHAEGINQLVVHTDGRRAASASQDGTVQVWDLAEGRPLGPPQQLGGPALSVAFSPDGRRVAAGGGSIGLGAGPVRLWETETGRLVGPSIKPPGSVFYVAFLENGSHLITCAYSFGLGISGLQGLPDQARVQVWRLEDGQVVNSRTVYLTQGGPFARVMEALIHPATGRLVAVTGAEVRVLDVLTGKSVGDPVRHNGRVYFAQLSRDGQRVVSAAQGGRCKVWEAGTGKELLPEIRHRYDITQAGFGMQGQTHLAAWTGSLHTYAENGPFVQTLNDQLGSRDWQPCFSPDGRFLASPEGGGAVRLWDVDARLPVTPVLRHSGAIAASLFADHGRLFLAGCSDGTVQVWDLALEAEPVWTRDFGLNRMDLLPNGQAVTYGQGRAFLFDPASGQRLAPAEWQGEVTAIRACELHRESLRLAVGNNRGEARVWDVASAKPLTAPLKQPQSFVHEARLSPDGRYLLTRSSRFDGEPFQVLGEACLWEVATGKQVTANPFRAVGLISGVTSIGFSPDSRYFALGLGVMTPSGLRGEARLHESATGQPVGPPLPASAGLSVFALRFSPNGQHLAAWSFAIGGKAGEVQLWTVPAGRPALSPLRFTGPATAEFDASGRRLVTACGSVVQVWELPSGRPAYSPLRHERSVSQALFACADRYLVTVTDTEVFLWDAATGEPVAPPVIVPAGVESVAITPAGDRLLVACRDGQVQAWNFAFRPRDAGDLNRMARLVSLQEIGDSGTHLVAARVLDEDWEALRTRYPEDFRADARQITAWHARQARACLNAGQWRASLPHLEFAEAEQPDDHMLRYMAATACLGAGDREGYRRRCQEMLRRFTDPAQQPFVTERVAKICLLVPGGLPDAEPAIRLARRLENVDPNHPFYPWFTLALGIAEYRAGRLAEAAAWLQKTKADRRRNDLCGALADLFLALVRQAQGRGEEARTSLNAATQTLERLNWAWGTAWLDRIHCQTVLAEARAGVEKK